MFGARNIIYYQGKTYSKKFQDRLLLEAYEWLILNPIFATDYMKEQLEKYKILQ